MIVDTALEPRLARLLNYGTWICSATIAIGMLLNALKIEQPSIDLVTVGIVGFIALPVIKLFTMLAHYVSSRDVPMVRVVTVIILLVVTGLVLGIIW